MISLTRRQHLQETDIHSHSGIPIHNSSKRAAIGISRHYLHSSPNIISVIKPRIIRLEGHVARMGTGEVRRRFWLGDMLERDHVEDLNVDGRIILKGTSRNGEGKHGLNFFGPG